MTAAEKAAAWDAIAEALARNAAGECSAADVCAVGFALVDEHADKCPACGQVKGTGSLYAFQREPPADVDLIPAAWRDFASRYRCPACAEAVPQVAS